MVDLASSFEPQTTTDLVGTEAFTQEANDQGPVGRIEPAVPSRAGAPAVGPFLRLVVAVGAVMARTGCGLSHGQWCCDAGP